MRLSIILDGVEEAIEETDFDDYVDSSFKNHEEGAIELEDLKFCMIEHFVQDKLAKYM